MVLGLRPGHLAEPGTRGGEQGQCPIPLQNPVILGPKALSGRQASFSLHVLYDVLVSSEEPKHCSILAVDK